MCASSRPRRYRQEAGTRVGRPGGPLERPTGRVVCGRSQSCGLFPLREGQGVAISGRSGSRRAAPRLTRIPQTTATEKTAGYTRARWRLWLRRQGGSGPIGGPSPRLPPPLSPRHEPQNRRQAKRTQTGFGGGMASERTTGPSQARDTTPASPLPIHAHHLPAPRSVREARAAPVEPTRMMVGPPPSISLSIYLSIYIQTR